MFQTVLMNEDTSQTTSTMDTALMTFLSKVGLENSYPNKLTHQLLLEINRNSIYYVEPGESVKTLPWCFLRQLYRVNAKCRNCRHVSSASDDAFFELDDYSTDSECNAVNPLDLIVALFLCADSFLQQEMALKMSMCQLSLPLLLPHGDNGQSTLMLWALRDIVKEWCPHDLSQSKGFVEENIVQANIPLFSFVRLKNCSLSKSQLLNHVLSRGQQKCNNFITREMEGGAVKREIANGLVEVCWYLPCGSENLDIFPVPATFTNLRGEMCESVTQFKFLFEVSTLIFVCLDRVDEEEHRILTFLQDAKSKLFLVVNRNGENAREDMMSVKTLMKELNLPKNRVGIKDPKVNVREFSKTLCDAIKTLLSDVNPTISIVNMVDKAVELDISVDEHKGNNQKEAAQQVLKDIGKQSIPVYKKQHLPLQSGTQKRLSHLEMWLKEKMYQNEHGKPTHMVMFSEQLSKCCKEQRDFFLKWMRLELNAHSRTKLSELRNQFKEQCRGKDVKLIAELEQALVDSSLGIEHYMREMGLIYEFSSPAMGADKISHLPGLAAEMLLDGYPLELLDGDASNIPERWVTDVLMELHKKVGEKSRLLVLTVLGVQSSGKSTLLNTMFGVQFPVSSGRCTRGAFMLFLKVGEDLKSELNCDFIVLIDTEGLKSPHLAQLEDSYEHDNQLATFVIGLSDVTIVNIAMENAADMKDVLQIVIYTLLRMKKREKRSVCHFVHQNVSGVSAHAKIMTERKHLLDQLNEMTQIAAEMERKHSVKQFTDVLDYDMEKNNWNIPGLWHGTPPMAPVNTGYSEAVAHFKKNLFQMVMSDKCNEYSEIPDFLEWMRRLWKAVKCENAMFSFRNSLVAHAFNNLFKEYTQWEWEFRKEILSWQTKAQSEILHVHRQSDTHTWNMLVESKKSEASEKVEAEEKKMKENLNNYYRKKANQVHLIENFIKDIFQSISKIADEIRHSLNTTLECCFTLQKQAQDIYSRLPIYIEHRRKSLLKDDKDSTLSDKQLAEMFEGMWAGVTYQHVHDIESLQTLGKVSFEVKSDHQLDSKTDELQRLEELVNESCTKFVVDQAKMNTQFDDEFTVELLGKIDQALQEHGKAWQIKFEIDLKLHICGIAAREFLKVQEDSLQFGKELLEQLQRERTQHRSDFLSLYKQSYC